MPHKTKCLFLFFMISISTTYTGDQTNNTEINFIDADVDVGTNATTLVLLKDSDVRPVYMQFC